MDSQIVERADRFYRDHIDPDLRSSAIENGTKPLGVLRALLELEQRDDLGPDQSLIESAGLPDRDALDIG
jgi:hypothetical protein